VSNPVSLETQQLKQADIVSLDSRNSSGSNTLEGNSSDPKKVKQTPVPFVKTKTFIVCTVVFSVICTSLGFYFFPKK